MMSSNSCNLSMEVWNGERLLCDLVIYPRPPLYPEVLRGHDLLSSYPSLYSNMASNFDAELFTKGQLATVCQSLFLSSSSIKGNNELFLDFKVSQEVF